MHIISQRSNNNKMMQKKQAIKQQKRKIYKDIKAVSTGEGLSLNTKMNVITLGAFILSIISYTVYNVWSINIALSLAITFCTITYHFLMRLAVGYAFDALMNNRADYSKKWYQSATW